VPRIASEAVSRSTPGIASALVLGLVLAPLLGLLVSPEAAFAGKKKGRKAKQEAPVTDASPSASLAEARELLDAERPGEAMQHLDAHLDRDPKNAEALLLRSTAHIMLGDFEAGRSDLERALELDPQERQAWLNLGAMEIAEQKWDAALDAFGKAEALDPDAPENHLNIGAVLLLKGELKPASDRFAAYLGRSGGKNSQGYYLVATNYALAGYAALAVEHLKQAISLEERLRLQARTDPNFRGLRDRPELQRLMSTDNWRPKPGAYTAARTFDQGYEKGQGPLLKAVLDTLQLGAIPFDSRVEVTSEWALIWGEMRIKVTQGEEGRGRVEVSAEADQLTPTEWRERVQTLFEGIQRRLVVRELKRVSPSD